MITDEMRRIVKRNERNNWARTQGFSALCFELFEQKYGKIPELVEVWNLNEEFGKEARDLYYALL